MSLTHRKDRCILKNIKKDILANRFAADYTASQGFSVANILI